MVRYHKDIVLIAQVQAAYALQIPFFVVWILLTRVLWSLQANFVFTLAAASNLALNIALDFFLSQLLGVVGIALATSIVYMILACMVSAVVFTLLRKRIQRVSV